MGHHICASDIFSLSLSGFFWSSFISKPLGMCRVKAEGHLLEWVWVLFSFEYGWAHHQHIDKSDGQRENNGRIGMWWQSPLQYFVECLASSRWYNTYWQIRQLWIHVVFNLPLNLILFIIVMAGRAVDLQKIWFLSKHGPCEVPG